MVGRAALADPWIFGGHRATNAEAATFLLDYARGLAERGHHTPGKGGRGGSRIKQLLAHWRAGDGSHGLLGPDRRSWLRISDEVELLETIARAGHL